MKKYSTPEISEMILVTRDVITASTETDYDNEKSFDEFQ